MYKLSSRNIEDYPNGLVLCINKPYRWTSADVIRKIKYAAIRFFNKKKLKVGHAGTLDPLADGVLLVCIGAATKRAELLQATDKEYIADIAFGIGSASFDLEKEIDREESVDKVNKNNIINCLKKFIGEQEQVAPLFSAKSVDGVRAYEIARKLYREKEKNNIDFDHSKEELLKKQTINIAEIELLDFFPNYQYNSIDISDKTRGLEEKSASSRINISDISNRRFPMARVRIKCSKGTYIRALARDIGEELSSCAMLTQLCRSKSGEYSLEESIGIEEALELFKL